ncbi:MAG: helix-turn-helix domain-containing protein, partial [Psychroflexus sp.]
FSRTEVSIDLAQQIVKNYVKKTSQQISIDRIQQVVSEYFQLDLELIQSKTRKRNIVQARQLAMSFSKRLTNNSLTSIGKQIGKRDHATVLHACKTVDNLKLTNKEFKKFYDDIDRKLKET